MKRITLLFILVSVILISILGTALGCAAPKAPAPTSAPTPAPTSAPTKVIQWKGQNAYVGEGSGQTGPLFAAWLKEHTGGRLVIDVAAPGAIVPVGDMYTAVSKGVLDFGGLYSGSYHTGLLPEANFETGLTFAWETFEEAYDAYYNRGLLQLVQAVYAKNNVYWMPGFPNQLQEVFSNFPITKLADMKGKKIRASGIASSTLALAGASVVAIPPAEIYQGLKLGTIDAALFGAVALDDMNLKEIAKYFIVEPNFNTLAMCMMMNMNSFNALPDDIKQLIQRDAPDALLRISAVRENLMQWKAINNAVKNYGLKLVTLPAEDITWWRQQTMTTVWDKVAAMSPTCAQAVAIVRQQMKDLGKLK